ncbi:hypothetical protein NIES4073_15050 [Kalymmatonema gypsitolerans NIES-4073]|nr:hypothetical protein NIES4073_15050 [Scytonema sp. NIES-4073]
MTSTLVIKKSPVRRNRWFERCIAIVALINLSLVFFDLTYVALRDFYLQALPPLTRIYDPVKGIEPHPETQNYLYKVNELQEEVLQTGLHSPQAASLLSELRVLSSQIIEDNPFDVANKSGTLAKIKNEIRLRTHEQSARAAFATFWSQTYLSQQRWQSEINFFNSQIRPLIETNYYRDIDKVGNFVNLFWLIDLPFVIIFALEYLSRTFYISRHNPNLNWLEAMLRRWYDLFLLLPFWRWLRVIPVTIRLYQAHLLNLEPVRAQLNHDFALSFAGELTEMVGIQIIDQMQDAIRRGDLARWLFHPETRRPYVEVNNTNEIEAIATRLFNISVYDVLPQVQPHLEALVRHTIESTLNESPIYQQIQNIPGLSQLPTQMTENLTKDMSQRVYSSLIKTLEDPVSAKLTDNLITNFRYSLEQELQKTHNLQEIQSWLVDMLEEVKINYVKKIAEGGMEKVVEEAENLRYQVTTLG